MKKTKQKISLLEQLKASTLEMNQYLVSQMLLKPTAGKSKPITGEKGNERSLNSKN